MPRKRFVLVSAELQRRSSIRSLRDKLNKSLDWVELFSHQWLLYTSSSPSIWFKRLRQDMEEGDHLFICEIDPKMRAGRMPEAIWKFINDRSETSNSDDI